MAVATMLTRHLQVPVALATRGGGRRAGEVAPGFAGQPHARPFPHADHRAGLATFRSLRGVATSQDPRSGRRTHAIVRGQSDWGRGGARRMAPPGPARASWRSRAARTI